MSPPAQRTEALRSWVEGKVKNQFILGDCLEVMKRIPPRSVDFVFGSPPYEDARTYGIDFKLKGQKWVDWMVEVYKISLRICKGLVAFVVQGKTRKFQWSATPALLMTDLHKVGIYLRRPIIYGRYGVPGSGSIDWLRSNYEFIICATNGGRLLWSNNTAMGHPPIWGQGGPMSNRRKNGSRVNQWGSDRKSTERQKNGRTKHTDKPSHIYGKPCSIPPIANPGDVIWVGPAGRGHMGSLLAHENEAPFPEYLAEFMIRSFCPPGGWVLDPFSGSGTTCAVAQKTGRTWTGIDIRQSQIELGQKRILEIK